MVGRKLSNTKTRSKTRNVSGRAVCVRGIDDARVACEAARATGAALVLWSLPFGAAQMGPLWFQRMVALIREEFPDLSVEAVLDCGDAPGHALAALRQGAALVSLTTRRAIRGKIEAIAAKSGARLVRRPTRIFDLGATAEDAGALRSWLADRTR
jgi:hypothetical protein